MAIYHLSMQVISRTHGRSAVAAAAYRSGSRIRDERTGSLHDYKHREGVVATGIVGWAGSRSQLWNSAEAAERRRNSRVAREITVALPHELPEKTRLALVEAFSRQLRKRHGVAVDWAVHMPDREGDQRNHHAHIMLTTREVVSGEYRGKTRQLDDIRQGPLELVFLRVWWEAACNLTLERAGYHERVDQRSYEARAASGEEVPSQPTIHMGPSATAMERRGFLTLRGSHNRAVSAARRAARRRQRDPNTTDESSPRARPSSPLAPVMSAGRVESPAEKKRRAEEQYAAVRRQVAKWRKAWAKHQAARPGWVSRTLGLRPYKDWACQEKRLRTVAKKLRAEQVRAAQVLERARDADHARKTPGVNRPKLDAAELLTRVRDAPSAERPSNKRRKVPRYESNGPKPR